MKPNQHPPYGPVVFRDRSGGMEFLTRSTLVSKADTLPAVVWSDGQSYPLVMVDISSATHPFWTGQTRVLDTAGQVEKFRRRYQRGPAGSDDAGGASR